MSIKKTLYNINKTKKGYFNVVNIHELLSFDSSLMKHRIKVVKPNGFLELYKFIKSF